MTTSELHTFQLAPGSTELYFNWEYATLLDEDAAYLVEGKVGGFEATIRFNPLDGFSGGIHTEKGPRIIKPLTPTLSTFDPYTDDAQSDPSGNSTPDVLDDFIWEFSEFDFCAAEQDVLFVKSSVADGIFPFISSSGFVPDFSEYVNRVVARANRTLLNSDVGSKSINAIVHDTTLDITFTGSTPAEVTAELHGNLDLQQLRQDNDADVVVYYTGPVQHASPTAGVQTLNVDYGSAYIMANMFATASSSKFPTTFAHEIGHINGAAHEKGHFFNHPNSGETQVTQVADLVGNNRIAYYSNPLVKIKYITPSDTLMIPTGTIEANNAIIVSNRFCTLAELEQPGDFHTIAATAWPNGYPLCYSTIQLEAQVFSGNTGGLNNGPYIYDWSYQGHPSQGFISFSNLADPVFSIPDLNHLSYNIRLTVTDQGTGDEVTDDLVVKFVFCEDFARIALGGNQYSFVDQLNFQAANTNVVYPKDVQFEVFDINGRRVLKSKDYENEIPNLLRNYLPAGIYILKETKKDQPNFTTRKIWID